ncbi:bifunctional phosphoribosylaminoimidazolecarboxamide formyltransferase/IMP cyclohydrolase [Alkalibacillus haloalkaliphilus]|uniref:bifunctional phosphoribosylaminoimidazolecarboxamide formyltransferase/IMP cyclohydrolase n=1 Tax=Alkalibacillus haloalkaliphilus TaxID=94136 RepID=UPI00293630FC|nr:bifunctional phosphoribosylaminoimidazolecarboxamide formyltransferase/IMP cyclohydrolase [Alkalibacillus haloalkaliphilus]MDV2582627.1 bifunctional phosphoribosylaminoimidazolecarboxamide formyltransferase/IMP cyclohydrolase [Alkalibacillus haloalkaliphilus]
MGNKRALISVSNKTGVIDFAKQLTELGYDVISTGGTKKALEEAGLNVISISEITHFPEVLDGRVKTLHPNVHAGLLAKRDDNHHMAALKEQAIETIDLVVVNLYPFKETIAKEDVSFEDAIENIDIGGPAMLRAAAKNHQDVTVVVDPADYDTVVDHLKDSISLEELNRRLAAKVYRHTAQYDALVANYLTKEAEEKFPETKTVTYERQQTLRYGENPHQSAAFYKQPFAEDSSLVNANQLHGKELSYNNIQDADSALTIVKEFDEPAAVAVKHTNPCGVGIGHTLKEAYDRAYNADPVSIFGGIVAFNREVDEVVAQDLSQIFLEIVIAPSFTEEALNILTQKKNIRLLQVPVHRGEPQEKLSTVSGGLLIQDEDRYVASDMQYDVVTDREPSDEEWTNMKFAWKVMKHVKSNAILLATEKQTIGVGAGQMNRVGAANIAIEQAGEKAKGAVMASDAFFPMDDTVEAAHQAGIRAIIQPGGSKRDVDSIKKCNEYGIAMVFTGVRHFKH